MRRDYAMFVNHCWNSAATPTIKESRLGSPRDFELDMQDPNLWIALSSQRFSSRCPWYTIDEYQYNGEPALARQWQPLLRHRTTTCPFDGNKGDTDDEWLMIDDLDELGRSIQGRPAPCRLFFEECCACLPISAWVDRNMAELASKYVTWSMKSKIRP